MHLGVYRWHLPKCLQYFSSTFIWYRNCNIIFPGGPAVFVLSWAIIKAFAIEQKNFSVDGVSIILPILSIYPIYFFYFQKGLRRYNKYYVFEALHHTSPFSLLLVDGLRMERFFLVHCYSSSIFRITWPNKSSLLLHVIFSSLGYISLLLLASIRFSSHSLLWKRHKHIHTHACGHAVW